ncbi:hypothetical protein LXA43DRAFT_902871, partial [Ganoderma leucocontextum]
PLTIFSSKVRMIAIQIDPSKRRTYAAVQALHEGAEDALVHLLARRADVIPEDIRVVREVLTPRRVIHIDPPEEGIHVEGFNTEVRQLLYEMGLENFEWEEDALKILQQAVEHNAVEIFEKRCEGYTSRGTINIDLPSPSQQHSGSGSQGTEGGPNEYRFCLFMLGRN